MTPTERLYALALALASKRPSEPTSKVELTLNAKGDVQISVDVTDTDPTKATDTASKLFDVLRAKYPRENGAPENDADKTARKAAAIARRQS